MIHGKREFPTPVWTEETSGCGGEHGVPSGLRLLRLQGLSQRSVLLAGELQAASPQGQAPHCMWTRPRHPLLSTPVPPHSFRAHAGGWAGPLSFPCLSPIRTLHMLPGFPSSIPEAHSEGSSHPLCTSLPLKKTTGLLCGFKKSIFGGDTCWMRKVCRGWREDGAMANPPSASM